LLRFYQLSVKKYLIRFMKNITLTALGCLFVFASSFAQVATPACGMTTEDQNLMMPRLIENLNAVEHQTAASDRDNIQYIPVHFHLVGPASGTGKLLERKILDQMCDMDDAYAPMNMRFYLKPHPTYGLFDYSINNDNVNVGQTNTFLMSARRNTSALNVYVVETPGNNNGQPGIILAYYNPTNDWIVAKKTEIRGGKNQTLPHETGHYFSLMHTFLGYESDSFDSPDAGWPIAPVTSPGGVPTEYQDKSNCATAADKICDTPPDYNFGFVQGSCATYNGGAKDPGGTLVHPMENNFMSYFSGCTTYQFTAMQQAAILADRASSHRNYLNNSYTPPVLDIATPTDMLVSPDPGIVTQFYDQINFQWQAVTGATYYLLEIDISSSFNSPLVADYITTGISKLITNLSPNKNYYWRVRPFNEYVTCASSSPFRQLKTGGTSGTTSLTDVSAWQISPNPTTSGNSVNISVQAAENFEATVSVFNTAGQLMFSQPNVPFPGGESMFELPTTSLSNGLYFVTLENKNGREVRKLSVLK
jgi:hypothetical protein